MMRIPAESRLAVIGAGPVGLEAAALAAAWGWDVAVFEKEDVAQHVRYWGHVQLFTPFALNHSVWGPELIRRSAPSHALPDAADYLTGRDVVSRYLEPLARIPELSGRIFTGVEVVGVGRDMIGKRDWIAQPRRGGHPFRLLLQANGRETIHRCRMVIDASGVYANPQSLGNGNIPAPGERQAAAAAAKHLSYHLVDIAGRHRSRFEGKRILLIGGGHSAATALEALEQLAKQDPNTTVYWINRCRHAQPYVLFDNDPLPYRDRLSRFANGLAAEPPRWLRCFTQATVEEIAGWPGGEVPHFEVRIQTPEGQVSLQADEIVAHVGYQPDASIYRQLQVHECYATMGPIKLAAALLGGSQDCLAQESQGVDVLRSPEPDFFILGNKSYGTGNTFLLQHGIGQVQTVLESCRRAP